MVTDAAGCIRYLGIGARKPFDAQIFRVQYATCRHLLRRLLVYTEGLWCSDAYFQPRNRKRHMLERTQQRLTEVQKMLATEVRTFHFSPNT